jgi:hypothetical protein
MRVLLYYILLYSYLIRTSFKRAFRRLFFVVLLFAGMLYSAQGQSYLFTGKQDTSSVNFATRNLTLTGNRIHNADNKTVDFINLPFPNSFQLNGVSLPDYPPIEDDVFLLYQTDGTFKYAGIDSIGQVVASDDQNLTLVEDTLSIEDGNSVVFSDFVRLQDSLTVFVTPDQLQDSLDNFPAGSDDQNLTLVEDTLSIEDGNSVVFSDFVRLQDSLTVFVTPDQLQDSLNNFPAGSDDQNLTLVEDTLSIEDGNSVVFSDFVRLQDSLTVFVTPDQLQDSLGGFSAIDSLFYQINNDPAIFVDQKNGANDTLNFSFSSIDTTQFVKYQDSLTVFVTPDQLSDSLANFLSVGDGNGIISALPAGNVAIDADGNSLAITNQDDFTVSTSGQIDLTSSSSVGAAIDINAGSGLIDIDAGNVEITTSNKVEMDGVLGDFSFTTYNQSGTNWTAAHTGTIAISTNKTDATGDEIQIFTSDAGNQADIRIGGTDELKLWANDIEISGPAGGNSWSLKTSQPGQDSSFLIVNANGSSDWRTKDDFLRVFLPQVKSSSGGTVSPDFESYLYVTYEHDLNSSATLAVNAPSNPVTGGEYLFRIFDIDTFVDVTWNTAFKDPNGDDLGTKTYITARVIPCYYNGSEYICED